MSETMEMQQDRLKEVLNELFTLLEAQETNGAAVLQLLKDEGIASDEKLASYLDQAGNASSVKWRAARIRMEYLLTPIQKQSSENAAKEAPKDIQPDKGNDKEKEQEQAKSLAGEVKSSEAKQSEAKSSDNADAKNTPTQDSSESNDTPPNNEDKAASVKSA